jgi:UDP-glucose 4-epimerase
MNNKNVLVTGAAGFIGSHVVDHCLKLGMKVTAVDDLSGGFIENVPQGCEFIKGDLREPDFVKSLWQEKNYDVVYHLAAYAAEGLSHFVRYFNYDNNLLSTINLINESIKHKVKTFVFTSSIAVYGKGQTPMTEAMVPQPEDPYGIAKYAMELDLKAAHEMFGMNYIIFRPHNVYGERQNIADKYRNVIGIFMNQVLQGKPMSVFGDGEQTRAFSHIDDVAPIIARAALNDAALNEVFNVGADTPYTVNELAKEVAAAMNVPCEVIHHEARNEVVHAYSDHQKVAKVFGHGECISLKEGIKRMADWVKAHGPMTPVKFDNIEILEKLPLSWRD